MGCKTPNVIFNTFGGSNEKACLWCSSIDSVCTQSESNLCMLCQELAYQQRYGDPQVPHINVQSSLESEAEDMPKSILKKSVDFDTKLSPVPESELSHRIKFFQSSIYSIPESQPSFGQSCFICNN